MFALASMAKSFRELVAWQLAVELRDKVLPLLKTGPVNKDLRFRDRPADSVRSAPRNIAEGYGRYNPAEIARYLDFARGSLDEAENHLRDGVTSSYFPAETVGPLINLLARCRKALDHWHTYLRSVQSDPRFQRKPRKPNRRDEPPS